MNATQSWPPEFPPRHSPWQPEPLPEPIRRPVPFVAPPRDDVSQALLDRRVVMVSGPLTSELANEAAARLMLLDGDSDTDVHLYLNCPGAELGAALMLADTVHLMRGPVHAVAQGSLGGAAVATYAAAPHRLALPHALFELREPRLTGEDGTAEALAERAALHGRQAAQLHAWLAQATGHDEARIGEDLRAGLLLDASGAVGYGLAHEVVGP